MRTEVEYEGKNYFLVEEGDMAVWVDRRNIVVPKRLQSALSGLISQAKPVKKPEEKPATVVKPERKRRRRSLGVKVFSSYGSQ